MSRTFIAYDTRSGRIVAAHHGPDLADYEWKPQFSPDLQVTIVEGGFPELSDGGQYTFDAATGKLVETLDQSGTSFGFGATSMSFSSVDVTRPVVRLPSRLFLYGLHAGPGGEARSAAAVGLLDSVSLDVGHVYPPGSFGVWSGVHSAARAGTRWLLFLDNDGRAATGTIKPDFGFEQAQTYPAGTYSDWQGAAVDGNGELLLTRSTGSARTGIGFAQVDPDGTFIVWWESDVALGYPDRLLGMPHAHAWLNTGTGATPTSTVSLVHRGSVVGSRTWNESWTGMAVHGDLLALYRGVRQFPVASGTQTTPPHYEVCRVGADNQITTLSSFEDFPATIADEIGADIDTPTGSLFYQFGVGSNVAEVRSLTADGLARSAALGELRQIVPDLPDTGLGWSSITPC